MDQCRKVREQLLDRWKQQGSSEAEILSEAGEMERHLADCPACLSFQRNLQTIGGTMDDLDVWAEHGTVAPGLAYFENLVNGEIGKRSVRWGNELKKRLVSVKLWRL